MPKDGTIWVYVETMGGGAGARPTKDGLDGVHVHVTNTSNLPVEALELEYPLTLLRYELVDGSGGAGKYRGGTGVVRDYRALVDGITVSLSSERQHVPAPGLARGESGKAGSFIINPGTARERKLGAAEADVPLPRGDVLSIQTPGGGGYGPPVARDAQSAETDHREGRLGPGDVRVLSSGDAA
jgi:N-methylhydantoinase B